ncbi:hypothetical protein NX059_008918 [Plenodomus lindquistii]|nr:hypothetical protein NX059_008918 [Plenodomus lindquistii]
MAAKLPSEASQSPVILITDYEQEVARLHEVHDTTEQAFSDDRNATAQEIDATTGFRFAHHSGETSDVFRDLESRYSDQPVSQADFFAPAELIASNNPSSLSVSDASEFTSMDDLEVVRDPTVPQIVIVTPEEGEALLEAQAKPTLKKATPLPRKSEFLESTESRPRARRRSMSMVPERPPKPIRKAAPLNATDVEPKRIVRTWGANDIFPDGGWRMRTRVSGPSKGPVSVDIVLVHLYNSTKSRDQDNDLDVFQHFKATEVKDNAVPTHTVQRARTDLGRQSQKVNQDDLASREIPTDHQVQTVDWLQDHDMLRKHMPESRIILVGFDVVNNLSLVPDYETAAGQLLEYLQNQREHHNTPIILTGHALAGLIVIQALALTSIKGSRAANVLAKTAGAFLFSCSISCPLGRARKLAEMYGAKSTDKLFSDQSGSSSMDRLSQLAKKGLFSTLHRERDVYEGPASKRSLPSSDTQIVIGYPLTQFYTKDDDQRFDSLTLGTFLGTPVRTVTLNKRFDNALRFTGCEDPDFLRLMLLMNSCLHTFQLLHAAAVGDTRRLNEVLGAGANPNLRDRW